MSRNKKKKKEKNEGKEKDNKGHVTATTVFVTGWPSPRTGRRPWPRSFPFINTDRPISQQLTAERWSLRILQIRQLMEFI